MPDPKNRLTVIETVYHQTTTAEPDSIESRFERELISDEQPYRRTTKVGEDWTPLDFGWIEEVGMIVIQNNEGKGLTKIPTPEEKEELAAKVLEISADPSNSWIVRPGESFRGEPAGKRTLCIRSRSGTTHFNVYAIPR